MVVLDKEKRQLSRGKGQVTGSRRGEKTALLLCKNSCLVLFAFFFYFFPGVSGHKGHGYRYRTMQRYLPVRLPLITIMLVNCWVVAVYKGRSGATQTIFRYSDAWYSRSSPRWVCIVFRLSGLGS